MKRNVKNLVNEFNNINKLKMFEVEVIDKRKGETDYIIFDIEVEKHTLFAYHIPLTKKQEKSKKIAFVSHVLDKDSTLDNNLECLYENCIFSILESDFYQLTN
jgi:hypothetical protein